MNTEINTETTMILKMEVKQYLDCNHTLIGLANRMGVTSQTIMKWRDDENIHCLIHFKAQTGEIVGADITTRRFVEAKGESK